MHLTALLALMSIPEGCAAIEYPTIKGNGERFRKWYEAFVVHQNNLRGNMGAELAWQIRNGVVHQLSVADPRNSKFVRIAFILPGSQLRMHMGQLKLSTGTWLPIYLAAYVEEVLGACERWLALARQDATKSAQIDDLLGYKQLPVAPFIQADNLDAIF